MKQKIDKIEIRLFLQHLGLRAFGSTSRFARGFTILFAVLIGSLLFGLGIAIAHLSVKELSLSSTGKESGAAFFAADTGIECALYWDRRRSGTFPNSNTAPRDGDATITCNNRAVALNFAAPLAEDAYPKEPLPESNGSAATTTFRLLLTEGCADVVIGKVKRQGEENPSRTVIESRGRSDCGTGVNLSRVERALRVKY